MIYVEYKLSVGTMRCAMQTPRVYVYRSVLYAGVTN